MRKLAHHEPKITGIGEEVIITIHGINK